MASATASSDVTDGPVLTLLNKRIRNLKKKLNRITQLEDSVSKGKSVIKNKEQEDLLKSKPSIISAVDELEKLRQPLSSAVDEEIALAVKQSQSQSQSESQTLTSENNVTEVADGNGVNDGVNNGVNELIEDLLKVIYFGSMFEVKSQSEFNAIMLTKTHERNCCLTYDYVTDDDAAVLLGETDLDLISKMSSLLVSRPVDSSFSHQNALQKCVEHAKLWVAKSDQPIDSNSEVTYASLREKLKKIIGSDYLKITPEMKATSDVAAEAAGNYGFQVPVQVESTDAPHEQLEDNSTDFQRNETQEDQSIPIEDSHEQHEQEAENSIETQVQAEQGEANAASSEYKEQYVPRRYHNQRGGGRNSGNGGRSGGRGYGGGRGGRSGGRGGFYQNGRNQYHEQPGNYYPSNQRNFYGGRGRGGRGNGGNGYNHHASGVEVAES
ncbi:hypothetical protein M8C21_028319 [Ambrosia artemisiifolia]|uniref:Glycine-rich protein n=1 Tax=Ambrosia artemisiifolia TaxID=4212 RepID=A0AAD5BZL6_AMBAR|nr:hypothetical protein M8C21_028319 [Ambrosia artemisiifolia]